MHLPASAREREAPLLHRITVLVSGQHVEPSLRLRDELRARGVSCVVLAESGHSTSDTPAPACTALAAVGISTVVAADLARSSSLLADLHRNLPRVLAAQLSTEAVLDDLQARGWIPAQDEIYTEDELETVTARLQELGYA